MRKLFPFLLLSLLFGCTSEEIFNLTESTAAVTFRDGHDLAAFCAQEDPLTGCNDYSDCASLVGKKAVDHIIGAPAITMTGQKGENPVPVGLDFCSDPSVQPITYKFLGGFDGSNAVEIFPHMGRLSRVEIELCTRPYVLERFVLPPLVAPEERALYPICGKLNGTWTFTGANGDQLIINIIGDSFPDCDNPDLYLIVGQWTVLGGSGRFKDATGGGCVSGGGWADPFDPEPQSPPIQWRLEGGIDF